MTAGAFVDPPSNLHPYECDGLERCVHCDRTITTGHDPATCALCADDPRKAKRNSRYERLRAAVVTVVDAEFGDDVPAIRQVLLDALDDEDEVEFVEAMERVPESAIQESPVPGSSSTAQAGEPQ